MRFNVATPLLVVLMLAATSLSALAETEGTCPPGLVPTTTDPTCKEPYTVWDYSTEPSCVAPKGAQCGLYLQYAPSALYLPPFSNDLSVDPVGSKFTVPVGYEGARLEFVAYEGNIAAPSQVWYVDITFTGWQPKCKASATALDLRSSCYANNGGSIDSSCWQCYSSFTGTITAVSGKYAGIVLNVEKKSNHAQIGYGANGKNCKFGLSFPFKWSVASSIASFSLPTCDQEGDLNIVLKHPDCCHPPSVKGDPHFVGFDGSKFDFHGEPDKIFNIISDDNLQLNALFVAADKVIKTKTYLGALGLSVGSNHLYIACDREGGKHVTLFNGQELTTNEVIPLDEEGTLMLGEDRKINIDLDTFFLKVRFSSSAHSSCHINLRASYKLPLNAETDASLLPHGILGQTTNKNRLVTSTELVVADAAGEEADAVMKGMNGEGAIEGVWQDYILESGDLFGTDFKYNRFVGSTAAGASKRRVQHEEDESSGFLHGASH